MLILDVVFSSVSVADHIVLS